MHSKRIHIVACLLTVLALTGCSKTAASPWEKAGVTEAFYQVAEDFSDRFLTLDADGARYDQALGAVQQYLDGTISQAEAQAAVRETLADIETLLEDQETVTLSEPLTEQLQAVGISAAEYELFANSRANQLQTQQVRLTSLDFYLTYAEEPGDALEDLRFVWTADCAEQDGLRGYYYYGNFNYWFPWADEAEQAYLQSTVAEQLEAYYPSDAVWYTDAASIEDRVMLYLDEVEAVAALLSEHLGQSQEELYEMEQDFTALQALVEEYHTLQEQLTALEELNGRLETLQAEIEAAKEAGDAEQLAQLKLQLEEIAAAYEALTAEEGS